MIGRPEVARAREGWQRSRRREETEAEGSLRQNAAFRRQRASPGPTICCRLKAAFQSLWLLMMMGASGCLSLSRPLPPVNLQEPSWSVHQGQAVWKFPDSAHDIAGDVLLATGPGERSFVQFSKSPFPLVIGQTTSNRWQVEFPPQHKRYAGPGSPPKRLIWLYLGRVMAGKAPPPSWTWRDSEGTWRLENPATGEALEGFFSQ
jgi:hypothetical protein